jgi:hydrogenase expression/formation protein HypE
MTATAFPPSCAIPLLDTERVQLGHGSGGKLSARLLQRYFLPHFSNDALGRLGDAAVLPIPGGELAVSTDTFVVHPLEFPGGDIGALAVHGTINDIAMMGAEPLYLTAAFVLEEGLPLTTLERIVGSMAAAARAAGVAIVAGDTKVVERGKADGLYINTTGIGSAQPHFRPAPDRAVPGDAVIVSGPLGCHGMAIMAARESIGFEGTIRSDSASLYPLVKRLGEAFESRVHVLRDPTRGGAASTLNEIAAASKVGIVLEESAVPVPANVQAACELLGLDPLYVANEGVLIAFVPGDIASRAVDCLRELSLGAEARVIGAVTRQHPGMVVMRTAMGGSRVVDMLPGDQLPRIC